MQKRVDNQKNKFPERLIRKRTSNKISQIQLAKKLGMKSGATISQWENGLREPCFDTLLSICRYLRTNCSYMLGESDADGRPDE